MYIFNTGAYTLSQKTNEICDHNLVTSLHLLQDQLCNMIKHKERRQELKNTPPAT